MTPSLRISVAAFLQLVLAIRPSGIEQAVAERPVSSGLATTNDFSRRLVSRSLAWPKRIEGPITKTASSNVKLPLNTDRHLSAAWSSGDRSR